jgi:uncharacterized phiE125 gp8 family phage protein
MASVVIDDVDTTTLQTQLLALTKSHLRVENTYDDAYIQFIIGRAIAWFENYTNVTVNGTTFIWTPDQCDFKCGVAMVPETPVILDSWSIADSAADDAADISANFTVTTVATKGVGVYALRGSFVQGMQMTFDSGYFSMDELPIGILNVLLLVSAHYYENREILVSTQVAAMPGFDNDVMASWWRPRV